MGFASITADVNGLSTAGLLGAGIMSGLAAVRGFVGAGAATGILVVAAVPVLTGIAGYGLIKAIKHRELQTKSNYLQIKQDIQDLIHSEMERLINNFSLSHLIVKKK